MSTIIIAAILVGSIAIICLFLVSIHNKHKREAMNSILKHFSQSGTENGLNFSSQELLHNCVFGLDGVNRKILVVTKQDDDYGSFVIDLDEVKVCTVKKIYGTIKTGDLKANKMERFLEKIALNFELHGKPSSEITFYQNFNNSIYEWEELEQKAKHWEAIFSKLQKQLKSIA